jgi:two-component system chemotaxis response regulator CheB
MTKKTRVLVVEDSLTVRRHLCALLAADPEIELAGEAADGKAAIELCRALRPDVVTIDMMLPVMTGLAATEYIMAHCPTPILIVSSSFNRGELFRTYDALAAGAVDVLEKPNGTEPDGAWQRTFIAKVKLIARIPVITHPRLRLAGRQRFAPPPGIAPRRRIAVIAIGASTGGPAAIVTVLRELPTPIRQPILLVMHLNEPFGKAFAEWLDGQTNLRVTFAADRDPVAAAGGRVVMAPPGRHLIVHDGLLRLTHDAERHSCRPSIDVLFEAAAREYGGAAAAALLTGMGRDGAAGLLAIRQAGGTTIAQDEASSIVYGMPREAVALGAAQRVLPLNEIGAALGRLAGTPAAGRT